MEWIETTGASLDEAKERALDRLGVAEDDLEVEVLAARSRTMFGLSAAETANAVKIMGRNVSSLDFMSTSGV